MSTLAVRDLHQYYGRGSRRVHALCGVSLAVSSGRALGVAGESGSGKSTLGRLLAGLATPDAGAIEVDGESLPELRRRQGPVAVARTVQMIFQDPGSSLNQRMTVGRTLQEALTVHRIACGSTAERSAEITRLLRAVGLDAEAAAKYPFQFSGGQRQRIAIARALAVRPRFLICDEPTSALDVSVQAMILLLLREVRRTTDVGLVVVTHNLEVVRFLCDEVVVMTEGRIVESGQTAGVFADPRDDYTRRLLAAVPDLAHEPFSALSPADRRAAEDLAGLRRTLSALPGHAGE